MTPVERKSARAKRLREDEAFASFVQEVRERQMSVFLNAASSQEEREEAHTIIRALAKIEAAITSAEDDAKFEQKGQHRGND